MRLLFRLVSFALVFGWIGGVWAEEGTGEKKDSDKKEEAVKKAEKGAKSAGSGEKEKNEKKEKREKEAPKVAFPVPIGHDSKGLKLPSFGPDGKLKMVFNIGVGTRIDEENVLMKETQVQTFKEDGSPEMDIDLPVSNFNLKTRVISTKQKVVITRDDFELSGNTMEFNTESRTGTLGGGVKMVIFDLADEPSNEDAAAGEKSALPKVSLPPNDKGESIKVTPSKAAPSQEPKPSE